MILTERMPGLTLAAMLEDCEFVREDRAPVSLSLYPLEPSSLANGMVSGIHT
jgi:hypothetical protein